MITLYFWIAIADTNPKIAYPGDNRKFYRQNNIPRGRKHNQDQRAFYCAIETRKVQEQYALIHLCMTLGELLLPHVRFLLAHVNFNVLLETRFPTRLSKLMFLTEWRTISKS